MAAKMTYFSQIYIFSYNVLISIYLYEGCEVATMPAIVKTPNLTKMYIYNYVLVH